MGARWLTKVDPFAQARRDFRNTAAEVHCWLNDLDVTADMFGYGVRKTAWITMNRLTNWQVPVASESRRTNLLRARWVLINMVFRIEQQLSHSH
jgi:hypothetical protein